MYKMPFVVLGYSNLMSYFLAFFCFASFFWKVAWKIKGSYKNQVIYFIIDSWKYYDKKIDHNSYMKLTAFLIILTKCNDILIRKETIMFGFHASEIKE